MRNKIRKYIFYLLSASLLLQGCAANLPQYKNLPKEELDLPLQFTTQAQKNEHKKIDAANYAPADLGPDGELKAKPAEPEKIPEEIKAEDLVNKDWRAFFKDEQLISLIEIALKNNQDLNILTHEINIASNEIMARQGQYLPKIGIGAGYDYEKTSRFTNIGADDEASEVPEKLHNRRLGLDASWEVDIWKKLRNFAKSAYYQYLASIEGKNFATTQLVAEIAKDYYELMSLDNQLDIVRQYVKNLEEAQDVVKWQQIAGRTTSLAVTRFTAEVYKNQSREYELQQRIIVTENHLNFLVGRLPQTIARPSDKFKDMKIAQAATNLPADLLNNRPDIKQASLKLAAAKLDVKAVKAQFYPSLNIDANVGYRSFNAHHFLSASSLAYDAAGSLTAPLLNRNAIKAEYFSANNRQIQAIYNYEKTFISAFGEVANQMAAVQNLQEIYDLKSQQNEMLANSFEISNILFRAARVDYLESLMTRRDYLEAQLELMEVKQRQLLAHVNLYKALGGGWREDIKEEKNQTTTK